MDPQTVIIDYTNYRGERALREVIPFRLWYGASAFHKDGQQWFLSAKDVRKDEMRDFAMKDIHAWLRVR